MSDLMAAQTDGAAFCLSALADPQREASHAALLEVLAQMGPVAEGGVLAALATDDEAFLIRVYSLAQRMRLTKATPYLLGPSLGPPEEPATVAAREALARIYGGTLSEPEAEAYLRGSIGEALAGRSPYWPDHRGLVEIWQWDDATRAATRHDIAVGDVGVLLAERMTRDLAARWPERIENRLLHRALLLQLAKMHQGYETPISRESGTVGEMAAALGAAEMAQVLGTALAHDLIGGAVAACEMLAEADPAKIAQARGALSSPLTAALDHGDRRLKFAALQAVLRQTKEESFPGAGRLPGAVGYFANSQGELVVVSAHPRIERAVQTAGLFEQLGYASQIATRGREVIELAQTSADVSLLLIDMGVNDPLPRDLVRALRHGRRTSRLPVALLVSAGASSETFEAAERIAAADPLTTVVWPPLAASDAASIESRLNELAGRNTISRAERLHQATVSLEWMGRLAAERNPLVDVRSQLPVVLDMAYHPEFRLRVIEVLSAANLPAGQRTLVDVASDPFVDQAGREAAGAAFRVSVARHGVLLNRGEMLRQYDRYNGADPANVAARSVLSSILDTLEGGAPAAPVDSP
jgi:CheY-like chemotaxis protein